MRRHVIVGNGPAGVIAAQTLRQQDQTASITLIGNEAEPPYSRMAIPYLLANAIDESGCTLRKEPGWFAQRQIDLVQGEVIRVDVASQSVALADGRHFAYDALLIATGSTPLTPSVSGMDDSRVKPRIHHCWTLADARAIIAAAQPGRRFLQLGAGFIGCIILEALVARKVSLTVVEMGDRMVPRMMTATAGDLIRRYVETQGVRVCVNTRVDALSAVDGAIAVRLSSGETLKVDGVIAAAGVKPNIALLKGSGIATKQGVLVDETQMTSAPNVYAAGDVTESLQMTADGRRAWLVNAIQPNAADQATIAATNMAAPAVAARSPGALPINVLDTLGLVSTSFGEWQGVDGGQHVEQVDERGWRYISLQFFDNRLIGATSVNPKQHGEHSGALRGLIQSRLPLGHWQQRLQAAPERYGEAYVACMQGWS